MGNADLSVEAERLKGLARDLDSMQEVLTKQLLRMDEIVDAIEARWRGPHGRGVPRPASRGSGGRRKDQGDHEAAR